MSIFKMAAQANAIVPGIKLAYFTSGSRAQARRTCESALVWHGSASLKVVVNSVAGNQTRQAPSVPVIDAEVAAGLLRVVQAARLLGAEVVLVGIRPEVAQTLVGLEIQLTNVMTQSDLQNGIAYALRRPAEMPRASPFV